LHFHAAPYGISQEKRKPFHIDARLPHGYRSPHRGSG
jgi:hypothetical protein